MKKNKIIVLVLAVAIAGVLTACTQKDSSDGSGAQTGATQTQGSGTVTAGAGTLAGVGTDGVADGSVDAGTGSDNGSSDSQNSGTATGTAETTASETQAAQTETTAVPEENYTDDQYAQQGTEQAAAENDASGWTGTYVSESGETLTLSMNDAYSLAFSFTNSGIYGTADLNGNQATYHGDDYHVTVFDYAGTTIEVSVVSEEDFDTSESPLNGIYTRQ